MTGVGWSAAEVNAEIRALWPPGADAPVDRDAYHRLLVEWARAVERERQAGQRLAA
ncbi:hypothetical protein QMZ92_16235 [Streptomyces sp. HNM0645]|uniref:hypothetical protein n=1 Tax=Streptomyces sp. HNM0645 TaxID=2782343 RepID=UPI0024B67C5D|nr:hypothetical protein [Streptomyces sp. HNM0645]MDI9885883.1 hypothetical protein [Streptomyces sp. HNM0645]